MMTCHKRLIIHSIGDDRTHPSRKYPRLQMQTTGLSPMLVFLTIMRTFGPAVFNASLAIKTTHVALQEVQEGSSLTTCDSPN